MAPRKVDHGAIIILDVGRNVSASNKECGKSFFEQARDCAARLIERKIISQDKNLVGILLLGSKETNNAMAQQVEGGFKHITMFSELKPPTWDLIRQLPNTVSQSKGDIVDAIIVAAEHFKSQVDIKIENKKIILMSNFKVPTTSDNKYVKIVLDGLEEDGYEVDVIGPDIYDEMAKGEMELAKRFVETTNGATASFNYVMRYLLFHKKKSVSLRPWNVDLSIGPNIKIPVSTYIRLKDDTIVKKWNKAVKDPVTNNASTTEAIEKKKVFVSVENQTALKEENEPIKGHFYGQRTIPFTELDKSALYESGDKCLSVYGFTSADNVKWQNLTGDGLHYVFGRKGDKKSQEAIRCLVECLHELKLVGIVRRVYNNNNAPKMFVLSPVIDPNSHICLSMASLCFKEDIKYMSFPSTSSKQYKCTDEQVKGFIDLIKAMDLTRAYDDTFDDAEALPIGETVSPFAQHMLDCIAFRAMHPDEPLPQPRDDIMNLFKLPPQIEARSKDPMEKLKSLFELVKIEKKVKKRVKIVDEPEIILVTQENGDKGDENMDGLKIELPIKPQNQVKRVGTLEPISDYIALKNDKPMAELAKEMTAALESLINGNIDGNFTKAFDAMLFFRKECVNFEPSYYNTWLQTFKEMLSYRKKHDILSMICEKNANFILKSENELSKFETAESHDESQLYENDTVPNTIDLSLQPDDDMFADF